MSSSSHYLGESGEKYFQYQTTATYVEPTIIVSKVQSYIAENATVLDFGCGNGSALPALRCGRRIGIEVNPVARTAAVNNGIECYTNLNQVLDETVDVVFSHHALEHVLSPLDSLALINSKLKPGGLLALIVPIDDWRREKQYDPDDINHHLYTWTPKLLGNLLSEAKFRSICMSVEPIGWFRHSHLFYRGLPRPLYRPVTQVAAAVFKTREIRAICKRPKDSGEIERSN